MPIGVRFVTNDTFASNLDKMGELLKIGTYLWYIDCLWIDGFGKNDLPDVVEKSYSGSDMLAIFNSLQEDFVQTVRIRRYSVHDDISPIEVFHDYYESACSLILFCMDIYEYEIYSKDQDEIISLFNLCLKEGYSDVELLEEDCRSREDMYV